MKLKWGIAAVVVFVVFIVGISIAYAQATHDVVVTWTASTTPNVTYNVLWSATGAAGSFTQVNTSPISGTTFTDTTHLSGFWEVDAVDASGDISVPSNQATVPAAPTGCHAVGQ